MKSLLIPALASLLLVGAAHAQTPPPPAAAAGDQLAQPDAPPPPGADLDDAGPGPKGPKGPPGGPGARRPPPPSKAAHFHLRQGATEVDVKCADDEPTRACVDAVLMLMDRLGAQSLETTAGALPAPALLPAARRRSSGAACRGR